MKNLIKTNTRNLFAAVFFMTVASTSAQIGAWDPKLEEKAEDAMSEFIGKDRYMQSYFDESYAYAIFPSIGKGGIVLGGAHGRGLVFEQGKIIAETKMTQISLGFQWGGQAYREVIFFKDKDALESFKKNELEFSGQVSAVAIKAGVSADIAYENGIAVYTMAKAGLMYEAALGGQKFKYFPIDESEEI